MLNYLAKNYNVGRRSDKNFDRRRFYTPTNPGR